MSLSMEIEFVADRSQKFVFLHLDVSAQFLTNTSIVAFETEMVILR